MKADCISGGVRRLRSTLKPINRIFNTKTRNLVFLILKIVFLIFKINFDLLGFLRFAELDFLVRKAARRAAWRYAPR